MDQMLKVAVLWSFFALSSSMPQDSSNETLQFPNTFYAEYSTEVQLGERVIYGSGFMASDFTSRRVEVTALSTGQGSITVGQLQLYDSTPPMDYFHVRFPNGTQDCKARQSNRSSLLPFWYWTTKADKIGTMNIHANTYDVWCYETKGVALSVGILSGGDTSEPALYIERRRNCTEQYYYYSLFQSTISDEQVFDVPSVCASVKGFEPVSIQSWKELVF